MNAIGLNKWNGRSYVTNAFPLELLFFEVGTEGKVSFFSEIEDMVYFNVLYSAGSMKF